ncbi:MAG TPA: triose-phosphate isomerase [Anaerolineales bacterium]|nr:triose-phosphate isomerase [Anaerolineales bacterium]
MRTKIIAGNWKMNKTPAEAAALAQALVAEIGAVSGVERVVVPPFVALASVAPVLVGSGIGLGAQNLHWADSGAYTGEVSAPMLKGLCQYVVIGHSERRQYFGETDESVNKKTKAALAHGLTPIVCVGETLAQYEAGETGVVVSSQVRAAYAGIEAVDALKTVVAYEPVWAIGTGRAATPEGANAVIAEHIRAVIAGLYGAEAAAALRIQYGGSVTAANAAELLAQPDIDGALVGGASLKAADFGVIVRAAA